MRRNARRRRPTGRGDRGHQRDIDVRRLFHGHSFDRGIALGCEYTEPDSTLHSVLVGVLVRSTDEASIRRGWAARERRLSELRGERPAHAFAAVASRDILAGGKPVDWAALDPATASLDPDSWWQILLPVTRSGGIPCEFLDPHQRHDLDPVRAVRMISTAGLSADDVVQLATQIALLPEEQYVLEAMQLVYPEIESYRPIATLVDAPALDTWGRSNRGGVIVKLRGRREPVPIGSLGDGVWRFLGLALSLATAAGGVLLVDEIDTGLHHTVLDKMWAMVATTAERLGVQVFATTHSRDCVESLASIARPGVGDGSQVTIQRIDPDKPEAIRYSEAEIIAAAEHGIEVR